ncbi:MAG: zinc-binding dehydrogenase [Rhodospirillales bacterium]|nr:zinc-binding dehydrogenase [Rhodospirillales bacterium]
MKTRAAVLVENKRPKPYAQSKPVVVTEVDLAPPGEGEVLVEIKAAGVCHSDLSVVNGSRERIVPLVLGHEASGVVQEVGAGVKNFKSGDRIVFAFLPSCGACGPCMSGRPSSCAPGHAANAAGRLLSGETRLSLNGKPLGHQAGVSCFAEHAVASERSLIKIEDSLSMEEACLFSCAVMTGVGAVLNTAQVPFGSTVGVVGLGGVGLNAILAAKMLGAEKIIAIDTLDSKLALARDLGATHTFNAKDPDCVEAAREATDGGVEYAFEAAGSVDAMDVTYRITRRGGTSVSSGLSHPDHKFSLSHVNMVAEERTIKGSYMGSCIPSRDIPRYISMYQRGLLPVDKLISAHIALDDINQAFDTLDAGDTIRQVIRF